MVMFKAFSIVFLCTLLCLQALGQPNGPGKKKGKTKKSAIRQGTAPYSTTRTVTDVSSNVQPPTTNSIMNGSLITSHSTTINTNADLYTNYDNFLLGTSNDPFMQGEFLDIPPPPEPVLQNTSNVDFTTSPDTTASAATVTQHQPFNETILTSLPAANNLIINNPVNITTRYDTHLHSHVLNQGTIRRSSASILSGPQMISSPTVAGSSPSVSSFREVIQNVIRESLAPVNRQILQLQQQQQQQRLCANVIPPRPQLTPFTSSRLPVQLSATRHPPSATNPSIMAAPLRDYSFPQQQYQQTNQDNSALPPDPARIIQRIQRGEFINFNSLLPQNIHERDRASLQLTIDGDQLSLSRENGEGTKDSTAYKHKVTDIYTWLMAWTLFFQIFIFYRPHMMTQLLKYQTFISNLAYTYNFNAWYSYDQAFRQHVANNPSARWDLCNDFIFNLHVRGSSGRGSCYSCGSNEHLSSSCPKRASLSRSASDSASRLLSRLPAARSQQPFLAPQRQSSASPAFATALPSLQRSQSAASSGEVCFRFNQGIPCGDRCQRLHKCVVCSGDHPVTLCPRLSKGNSGQRYGN